MGAVLEFFFQAIIESALITWVERWPRWLQRILCLAGIALLLTLLFWAFL